MEKVYIAIAIVVLAVLAVVVARNRKRGEKKELSKLAGLASAFVLAGLIFGESRLVGYSLIGFGVFLALVDMARSFKK